MGTTTKPDKSKKALAIYQERNQWKNGFATVRSRQELNQLCEQIEKYCEDFGVPFDDIFLYEFEIARKYTSLE